MTKRLFVGLKIPTDIAEEILRIVKKLKINFDQRGVEAKWPPFENYHITVNFLGDTPPEKVPEISRILKSACQTVEPFTLKLSDLGGFPTERSARVVYIGVQKARELLGLQAQLESKFSIQSEFVEYNPHLTIGRLRNALSVKDLISPFVRKKFGKIVITEIGLYESKIFGPFPQYILLDQVPLKTPEQVL